MFVVWSRRQRRVRVNRIRVNDTGRDSMPNWTHWPVSCLTRLQFSPNWIVSPFWDCPLATCAPRAIFKVNNQQNMTSIPHSIITITVETSSAYIIIYVSRRFVGLQVVLTDGSNLYSFPFIYFYRETDWWLKLKKFKIIFKNKSRRYDLYVCLNVIYDVAHGSW